MIELDSSKRKSPKTSKPERPIVRCRSNSSVDSLTAHPTDMTGTVVRILLLLSIANVDRCEEFESAGVKVKNLNIM